MSRELPGIADDTSGTLRRALLSIVVVALVFGPTVRLLQHPLTGSGWFQVCAAVIFAGLVLWTLWSGSPGARRAPWIRLTAILGLAIGLYVAGGPSGPWIPALALAAGMYGRYSNTLIPALLSGVACAVAGLIVSSIHGDSAGNTFAAAVVGPLASMFAYSAGRRADAVEQLRRTRAELARAAVAEERLRIARDLHDLLGHSLSLITLKAELAGRVIGSDADRAAREIAELEGVARQSLSDVREAVAGFRQPDLAGELAAARQLLDAAGIAIDISSAGTDELAQQVDAALAWAVREGTTNVVRHSHATKVAIRVSARDAVAVAEISDNGPAAPEEHSSGGQPAAVTPGPAARATSGRPRPAFTGSGLAGLAERVRGLDGELAAGPVEPQGFLLRVIVPLSPQA